jgi:hypothetical protein
MDKKGKSHLTNEDMTKKFKSSFELVNYAIKLAENMIKTGRDARVKSEVQNRAMLILEEIYEGKDQFDEIQIDATASPEFNLEAAVSQGLVYEEKGEKRKYRTSEAFEGEE